MSRVNKDNQTAMIYTDFLPQIMNFLMIHLYNDVVVDNKNMYFTIILGLVYRDRFKFQH